MGVSVHPQAQQILDGKAAAGAPPLWELSPDEGAGRGRRRTTRMIPAGPDMESVRDIVIPSQAGGMPARVYSPSSGRARRRASTSTAAAGWSARSTGGTPRCAALAVASGCDVVSVDYRLAPEHVFPAAADDAYDALAWAASPAGLAAGRPIVVAGDSAGGNLAAVSALRARDSGGPPIALQVLVYPVVDCDLDRRSYHEYDGDELILNRRDMVWFWDHYAPDPAAG